MDDIKRLLKGDCYIGRGSKQRRLAKSVFCNPYKVSQHGRYEAIRLFSQYLKGNETLRSKMWTLSGLRLICHCRSPRGVPRRRANFRVPQDFSARQSKRVSQATASRSTQLPVTAQGRSGFHGRLLSRPLMAGTGYTERELCDGQTLASPGRWPPSRRRYPSSPAWESVSHLVLDFARTTGAPALLTQLAPGRVQSTPYSADAVRQLKTEVEHTLEAHGHKVVRQTGDREDLPIDFRFLQAR